MIKYYKEYKHLKNEIIRYNDSIIEFKKLYFKLNIFLGKILTNYINNDLNWFAYNYYFKKCYILKRIIIKKVKSNSHLNSISNYNLLIYINEENNRMNNKYLLNIKKKYRKTISLINSKINIKNLNLKITISNFYSLIDRYSNVSLQEEIYNSLNKKIMLFQDNIRNNVKKYKKKYVFEANIDLDVIDNIYKQIIDRNLIGTFIDMKHRNCPKKFYNLFSDNYEYNIDVINKYKEIMLNAFSIYGSTIVGEYSDSIKKVKLYLTKNSDYIKGINISSKKDNDVIILNTLDSIDDLFILAHEYGHTLYNFHDAGRNYLTYERKTISEIIAITNELVLNDYLVSNRQISNSYMIDTCMKILFDGCMGYSIYNNYLRNDSNSFEAIEQAFNNITLNKIKYSFSYIVIDDLIFNLDNILIYFYSLIVSINIYLKFKSDDDYFIIYKNFIDNVYKYTNFESLFLALKIDYKENIYIKKAINYLFSLINENK